MDEPVKPARWRGVASVMLVWSILTVLAVGTVVATDLPDPTQPPARLLAPAAGVDAASEISQPVLQSVLISRTRRRAMISGQTVVVGSQYQDARVVNIREGEVVLQRGRELQTLKLFPDLQKNSVLPLRTAGSSGAAHLKPHR